VRLFDRLATGMELTSAGRNLLAHATKVLAAAESLKQAARSFKGEITGTLRIGTVSDPHTNRIGELLNCALRRFPGPLNSSCTMRCRASRSKTSATAARASFVLRR